MTHYYAIWQYSVHMHGDARTQ